MTTLALAQELKGAGFPQGKTDWVYSDMLGLSPNMYKNAALPDDIAAPTLEELIEACGKSFYSLIRKGTFDDYEWQATAWTADADDITGRASTPTEAVARLWLVLNTKV